MCHFNKNIYAIFQGKSKFGDFETYEGNLEGQGVRRDQHTRHLEGALCLQCECDTYLKAISLGPHFLVFGSIEHHLKGQGECRILSCTS